MHSHLSLTHSRLLFNISPAALQDYCTSTVQVLHERCSSTGAVWCLCLLVESVVFDSSCVFLRPVNTPQTYCWSLLRVTNPPRLSQPPPPRLVFRPHRPPAVWLLLLLFSSASRLLLQFPAEPSRPPLFLLDPLQSSLVIWPTWIIFHSRSVWVTPLAHFSLVRSSSVQSS